MLSLNVYGMCGYTLMLLVRNVTVNGCAVFVGRSDYLELFRDYVSKNSADCGKAVLEKLGLTDAAIAECFRNNHGDVVEAVQDGLKQWSKGQGSRPSTWGVLLRAIEGNIAIQHRNKLKAILGQPGTYVLGVAYVLACVCTFVLALCTIAYVRVSLCMH